MSAQARSAFVVVDVPMIFQKRGGKRQVIIPDFPLVTEPETDNTLIKALGRAFRWRRLLENGTHCTITDLAAAEKINSSYVSRILRLTLLSPKLIEAALAGTLDPSITIARLMKPFDYDWNVQHQQFTP